MKIVEEKKIFDDGVNEEQENAAEQSEDVNKNDENASTQTQNAAGEEDSGETPDEESTEPDKETSKADKKEKKRKEKADKKQDALKEKIDELEDRVKRQMAEFDNFRKRTDKEKTAMFETGAKSVIEKILPVVDNFERGLASVPESEKGGAFAQGMEMIYKQLMTELEAIDVKPIEAVGQEFDPEFHNAVMQVESEEYESGIIAQELQKGYTYRDSVVRHSMVAVVS
ncbi:MAG: nucleotide exchange factor GrpE [Roseburia sp.]|nr:nucleotide exchange factor GrpE [Roseburia sp.]MCM1242194.1 nucleotide exchange factor GrpE [Roseburia sp.]